MCVCTHVQACMFVCGCLCFCVWKPMSMSDIFNSHSSYYFSRQGFSQNLEHIGLLGCQPASATEQPSYTSPEQRLQACSTTPTFSHRLWRSTFVSSCLCLKPFAKNFLLSPRSNFFVVGNVNPLYNNSTGN